MALRHHTGVAIVQMCKFSPQKNAKIMKKSGKIMKNNPKKLRILKIFQNLE
jgi:hypothetical protein